jgi:hypothetical protein
LKYLIRYNVFRIAAVVFIVIGFFIYRSYNENYKISFELKPDYKPYLVNSAIYQDSFFNVSIGYSAYGMDHFFDEFNKNHIPLTKYYNGSNDEEIIGKISNEISDKLDSCIEIMEANAWNNNIYVSIKKLANGNIKVNYDQTETIEYEKMFRLLTSPEMPFNFIRVKRTHM